MPTAPSPIGPNSDALSEQVDEARVYSDCAYREGTREAVAWYIAGWTIALHRADLKPVSAEIWNVPTSTQWCGRMDRTAPHTDPFWAKDQPELAIALAFELLAGSRAQRQLGDIPDATPTVDEAHQSGVALEGAAAALGIPVDRLMIVVQVYLSYEFHDHAIFAERLAWDLRHKGQIGRKGLRRVLRHVPILGREALAQKIISNALNPAIIADIERYLSDREDFD